MNIIQLERFRASRFLFVLIDFVVTGMVLLHLHFPPVKSDDFEDLDGEEKLIHFSGSSSVPLIMGWLRLETSQPWTTVD